ncbi:MAG: glycosyltransferase family 4 protein [Bacteroidales bacterium]|jgi:hypothetical protein|nr:glycosyltransferase family 4 protein [Bacteroidales bacterium]
MNILFLTLNLPDESGTVANMYYDLITEFRDHGHQVTVMSIMANNKEVVSKENGIDIVRVKTPQTQNVKNLLWKGVAYALLPYSFKRTYKRYLVNKHFDWIFLPTPPITLVDFVFYVKKKSGANFYLILRDIHPQSAASIGLIKNKLMYNYLEKRARKGYNISELIGCMSQGNINYIKSNYPALDSKKLVLLYNWQKAKNKEENLNVKGDTAAKTAVNIRGKIGLENEVIALFGGNIGYGQRIENLYNLARHYKSNSKLRFLVIGKGVMKEKLKYLVDKSELDNVIFLDFMPRNEYLQLVESVDIGLISINEKYNVPTCPSKAVSYMALGIPIFAMINPDNDYGQIIEDAGAGYWTVGGDFEKADIQKFDQLVTSTEVRIKAGQNALKFYTENLTSEIAYNTILNQISNAKIE